MSPVSPISASPTWIHNAAWLETAVESSCPLPLHGTLTRHALDCGGSLSLEECFALAAPYLTEAVGRWLGDLPGPGEMVVIGAHQVHGDKVTMLREEWEVSQLPVPFSPPPDAPFRVHEAPETDAFVTTMPGAMLVIKTADCLPILFWDPTTRSIGAAHCGWRGLMAGLAAKTLRTMFEIGASPSHTRAWLGPGIRARHYEVSSDLADKFRAAFPDAGLGEGRHLDLFRVASYQLEAAGLPSSSITDSCECTFTRADRYHSYRRDGELAGRLLTVIALPPG
jgi:YfiH family protein